MSENTNTTKGDLPVFYTRNAADFQGTKISLWANTRAATEEGKKPAQFRGQIGTVEVQLWEASSARGPFYNVKTSDEQRNLVQIGTANAYVTSRGFNALSISLKFDSEQAANEAKEKMGIKEAVKPFTKDGATSYFVNLYADVSRRAIEANPQEYERLGFKIDLAKQA